MSTAKTGTFRDIASKTVIPNPHKMRDVLKGLSLKEFYLLIITKSK